MKCVVLVCVVLCCRRGRVCQRSECGRRELLVEELVTCGAELETSKNDAVMTAYRFQSVKPVDYG